jgi:putative FmdB family regulatory protein
MPTYDYECKACGHVFEHFQMMSDDPLKDCPKCGQEVRRLIGGGLGIIFKGSGFYVTDNRSAGNGGGKDQKPESTGSSSESSASSSPESGGKTESKKTESKGDSSTPKGKAKSA